MVQRRQASKRASNCGRYSFLSFNPSSPCAFSLVVFCCCPSAVTHCYLGERSGCCSDFRYSCPALNFGTKGFKKGSPTWEIRPACAGHTWMLSPDYKCTMGTQAQILNRIQPDFLGVQLHVDGPPALRLGGQVQSGAMKVTLWVSAQTAAVSCWASLPCSCGLRMGCVCSYELVEPWETRACSAPADVQLQQELAGQISVFP